MRWPTLLLSLLLGLPLLVACQSAAVVGERWFRPPVGREVVLKAPLTVPAGAARIFLQRGEAKPWRELRQLRPHCHFEVREVRETPQTIHPDTFRVNRVVWGYEQVVRFAPRRVAQAGVLEVGGLAQGIDDGGLPAVSRYVRLDLVSAAQPQVMRLTCHGRFDDWEEAEEPTPEEIRAAVGGWLEFTPP